LVSAQICAFFCGIEAMQPWYYDVSGEENSGGVNGSTLIVSNNGSDVLNDIYINSVPTLLLVSSTTPFVATAIFYLLICIKMNRSKRLLDSLEVAAFNKHRREVSKRIKRVSDFVSTDTFEGFRNGVENKK
jgi:hypothetical protein